MTYEVTAEVPDDREGITTLVTVRTESYTLCWLHAEDMKSRGWKVRSAPQQIEWPTSFPLEHAA